LSAFSRSASTLLRSVFDIGSGIKLSQCPVIESSVDTQLTGRADLYRRNQQLHFCRITEDSCFDSLQTYIPSCR